jgi:hypothetical protein
MSGLIIVGAFILALVILDILAQTVGVDSRPEFGDPRAPERGITV